MAAGVIILQEAGGHVTKGDGTPFSIFAKSMLASNTALHPAVRVTQPFTFSSVRLMRATVPIAQMLEKVGKATRDLAAGGFDLSDWFVPEGYVVHR